MNEFYSPIQIMRLATGQKGIKLVNFAYCHPEPLVKYDIPVKNILKGSDGK